MKKGRAITLASVVTLSAPAGLLAQGGTTTAIRETFASNAMQDTAVSGGVWNGGARPGLLGGDGRHGSFDASLGNPLGNNVYEWNTDQFVIPASASATGQQYTVTDGRFFFTDMVIPQGVTVRFTGTQPPVIRVRGRVEIAGTIDINGQDIPFTIQTAGPATGNRVSVFDARFGGPTNNNLIMQGTSGGPGAGRGGNGAQEGDDNGPQSIFNGQPGEDVGVRAGHAYLGNTAGTGGAGSQQTPASGAWSAPFPLVGNVYSAYFSPGGGGGGFGGPGTQANNPTHTNQSNTLVTTPRAAAGGAFSLQPYPPASPPAGYTSLDHFLVGGSGGGGGGSHGYGLLSIGPSPNERWMKGHAGSGGGGAAAIRCGGTMTVATTAVLTSRGGAGVIIAGDDPTSATTTDTYGISSPGGGGSGGSFVLQSAQDLSFGGTLDTRGAEGSVNGFMLNSLQSMSGKGGDGADGYFRLESASNVAFGGSSFPAFVQGQNSGPLTDRDTLSGDRSTWYPTSVNQPTWGNYEVDVDTDGDGLVDVTYTDSGAAGAQLAYEPGGPTTLPLVIEFQSATALPTGGVDPSTFSPWRQALGGAAATNLNSDGGNTVRWRATYNRATYPDMVVMELRMNGTGSPPNPTAPLAWSNVWTSPGTVAQGGVEIAMNQRIEWSPTLAKCLLPTPSGTWDWGGQVPNLNGAALNGTWTSSQRCASAFDVTRDRLTVFGGGDGYVSDATSTYNTSTWSATYPPIRPGARFLATMVEDRARAALVLFGGQANSGNSFGDTWEFDGSLWHKACPATTPPARWAAAMAYDSTRNLIVLFGGASGPGGTLLQDTWTYDGLDWQLQSPANSPAARRDAAMDYDPVEQRMILVGGADSNGPLDEVWSYDGLDWYQLAPPSSGPADIQDIAYDESRQRFVIVNRVGSGSTPLLEVWELFPSISLAAATPYGTACGNLTLASVDRPIIGQNAVVELTNAPTPVVGMNLGTSNTFSFPVALPFELSAAGMPGCYMNASTEAFGLPAAQTGPSTWQFSQPIPLQPALIGQHYYVQGFAYAPGANALEVITSNGIDWEIGDV